MMLLNLFLVLILLLSLVILTMLISLSSWKSNARNLSLNSGLWAYVMSYIKYFRRLWLIDLKGTASDYYRAQECFYQE